MSIEATDRVWSFQLQMKKALGIDLGDARVGVAVSDDLGMLAHPLETITVRTTPPLERILQLAAKLGATTIVVGMPRNMDGSHGPAAEKARTFIDALRSKCTCEIISWDERLTTVSASRALHESGKNTRQQKTLIDQVAAQIILQGWLDATSCA
jgi:putative holliday junction resolvase